jgi:uridine kinase
MMKKAKLVVGIAGGTGSGKTTIARNIVRGLPHGTCVLLEHDGYYRDSAHLDLEERAMINYDHPDALETELLLKHIEMLRQGEAIEKPRYDYATHSRSKEKAVVEPVPVVVVEGILIFADPDLRKAFDIRIFVDTDADIRVLRRLSRDTQERGRTIEAVIRQYYATVRPMHLEFVEPSKRWADVIIPEGGHNAIALDLVIERLRRFLDEQRDDGAKEL